MNQIAILCGSQSCEHDISVLTALQVLEKIKNRYNVHILYITIEKKMYSLKPIDFINHYRNLSKFLKNKKEASFIHGGFKCKTKKVFIDSVILTCHGKNGEDGILSAMCEFYDLAYVGPQVLTAAITLDKAMTHKILEGKINMTPYYQVYKKDFTVDLEAEMAYPLIIKANTLGSSIGIYPCFLKEDYVRLLYEAFKYDESVIVESFLEDIKEYNIACYQIKGQYYFSEIEQVIKKEDILTFKDKYEDKYHKRILNADIDDYIVEMIQKMALETCELLNVSGVVRMDFMVSNGKVYLGEINAIPGALAMYLLDDDVLEMLLFESKRVFLEKKTYISSFKSNIYERTSIKK